MTNEHQLLFCCPLSQRHYLLLYDRSPSISIRLFSSQSSRPSAYRNRNRQFKQRLFRRSSPEALPTQQNQTMMKKDGLQTAAEERQIQSKEFRTEAARQSIPTKSTNNGNKQITTIDK